MNPPSQPGAQPDVASHGSGRESSAGGRPLTVANDVRDGYVWDRICSSPMVVIMGWGGGRTKDLGPVATAVCPNCHNDVFLHHIRSDKQFSLYFVPLASYGGNEYLACPICQHGLQLPPAQSTAAANMRAATSSYLKGRLPEAYYRQTVDGFWAHMGVNPNGQQVVHGSSAALPPPQPAAAPATAAGPTLAQQLKGLGELRDQGTLTQEEFAAAKKRLLEG